MIGMTGLSIKEQRELRTLVDQDGDGAIRCCVCMCMGSCVCVCMGAHLRMCDSMRLLVITANNTTARDHSSISSSLRAPMTSMGLRLRHPLGHSRA